MIKNFFFFSLAQLSKYSYLDKYLISCKSENIRNKVYEK